jgi:hypothetical protein
MTSSRTTRRLRIVAICTLLAGGLTQAAPRPAFAQRSAGDLESARQLYNQGVALRDSGDARGALEKLRAAHALGNTPITGVELCKVHASLAQPVEARETCLGVGRIPPLAGETSRSQDARNEAARIAEDMKARIASVRLQVTGVPPGREPTVLVDGAPVPYAALGELRAVNPGRHDVVAKIGRGPETRSTIDLAPGESKVVALPVQAPPEEATGVPAAPGPGDDTPRPARSNTLATAAFVVGGIGVGVGAITGVVALSGKSDLAASCTDNICGKEDHDALDSARRWGTVSTVTFVIGGAALLVGLIATLSAPKASGSSPSPARMGPPPPRDASRETSSARFTVGPDFGPGGLGIHGAF